MSDSIPQRTWRHDGALDRRLEIGETVAGDDVIEVAVRGIADGLRVALSPDQADEIADSRRQPQGPRCPDARYGGGPVTTLLRALSVKQPWSECIALGEKLTENRTWATNYRGPLAIHAGKRCDEPALDDLRVQRLLCGRAGPDPWDGGITTAPAWVANRGVIVALAELVDCHAAWRGCCQPWGDPESWHWVLENVRRLSRPIPIRGQLGLFQLPEDVARIVFQAEAVAR